MHIKQKKPEITNSVVRDNFLPVLQPNGWNVETLSDNNSPLRPETVHTG